MAILRASEIRKMNEKDIQKKNAELRLELAKERANTRIGATATSPGRIKEIKRTIARIKTVRREKGGKNE